MKPKIVFIINSIKQARCIRRVQEFKDAGYSTEVYAFDRSDDKRKMPDIEARVIGLIQNGSAYLDRLRMMRNVMRELKLDQKGGNVIYYLFSFDVSLAFLSLHPFGNHRYIYEVSDLEELKISNLFIRKMIVFLNKKMMLGAMLNVFTSTGFKDFYRTIPDEKITVVPNRISSLCPATGDIQRSILNINKIRIGFVGIIRYETILHFAKVVANDFPEIELHFYGIISRGDPYALEVEKLCESADNLFLHGAYESPGDLPNIYDNIDFVLSTYPPIPSVIYAEPNKLYEAIYFRCPIIVGKDTFLGRKVENLGIGYVIDAMNENAIKDFLASLNENDYQKKVVGCRAIPQKDCLNTNDEFFKKMDIIC